MPKTNLAVAAILVVLTCASGARAERIGIHSEVLAKNPALASLVKAAGGTAHAVFRKGGVTPTYVSGALSATTGLPEKTSVLFLAQHGAALGIPDVQDVVLDRVFDVGTGSVVRFHQSVGGVPVEHSGIAVRTDVTGRVLAVSAEIADVGGVDTTPALTRGEALVHARDALISTHLAHAGRDAAGLVILPLPGGRGRLAWKVHMGAVPALLSNPIVYVDALTGRVLAMRNAVWFDRLANVYPQNPINTPDLVEVTLANLPSGSTHLTGDRTLSRNCIDQHETVRVNYMGLDLNVHMCTEVQQAQADGSGDFLFDPEPLDHEDDFAEAQMYYAVELAYDYYQSLGFDLLPDVPIPSTVNFRTPIDMYGTIDMAAIMAAQDPYGELFPFDNAMFMEAGDMLGIMDRDTDSMVFGQGSEGDFAFDGDVVTHEFGHAVVAATCGLGMYSLDEMGLDPSTGALNEAYADTGTFCSTDDPVVGDYAGSWLTGGGIRDVDVDNACPADLTGESHEDSLMFTGAEWDILQALPGDEETVKQAFFNTELTLNPSSDFEEAATALVSEIRTALGDSAADEAQAAVDAHNLQGCVRVVEIEGTASHPNMVHLPAAAMVGATPFVPGPLQFRFRPDGDVQQLTVHFATFADPTSMLFGGESEPLVLFKRGSDPIAFDYGSGEVSGDWDQMKTPETGGVSSYSATFWIDGEGIPEDDYHFMLASAGQSGYVAGGVRVTTSDEPYPTDEDLEPVPEAEESPEPADEVEPVPDALTDPAPDDDDKTRGCGCAIVS